MNNVRRAILVGSISVLSGLSGGAQAADAYPSHPVTFVVPRAPGGGSDVLIRLLQPDLTKKLGATVIIENRPDATAIVGAELVARSKPDGYMLYLADNSFYQNPAIIPKIPYDTIKDFSAVTMMAQGPVILLISPKVGVKTVKELVALAKKEPGQLSFASGGIGASTHLAGVQFDLSAGVSMIHAPFKSSGDALNALLGDHVTMQYGGISSSKQLVRSGRLIALGVTGDKRDPTMPEVPTLAEAGVPGVDIQSVWGVHAPANTPIAVRRTLRDAIVAVMREPAMTQKMAGLGYAVVGNTPEEHQKETDQIVQHWIDVSKKVDLHK